MPMHPPAPRDRAGLIDAFDHSVRSIIDLGLACREADFERETECPGWTVKDQLSHVVGAEKALAGIRPPRVDVPDLPHVRYELGRLAERDVLGRRAMSGRDVVAELADFHPERIAALRESPADVDTVIGGFFGPDTTFGRFLHLRVVDAWCHEQDIRSALDRPGNLDSGGAALFTADVLAALPRVAARVAAVEPGHAVVIDVTGPVVARAGVRVVTGADGRPFGEPLFSGRDRTGAEGQVDVTTVHLTTEALTRRAAGRRDTDGIHWSVSGSEETARRVLDALVITH